MDDKKFWQLVEQMDWDHKKILGFPEEDQLDFCETFTAKQRAMQDHQTFCCDSAMDGSWSAVAWGKEHYDKLWEAVEDDADHGSEMVCDYSRREGRSGEMLGYRIRGLAVLLGGPESHYDIEPPPQFAKLLQMPVEDIMPLWNRSIRPLVETPEAYLAFREDSIQDIAKGFDGKVDPKKYARVRTRARDAWNERYAEHVGAKPEVRAYTVNAVFLVKEEVEVEARSRHEAIEIAEKWAEENAGDREVLSPHSMYHCDGWEVSG